MIIIKGIVTLHHDDPESLDLAAKYQSLTDYYMAQGLWPFLDEEEIENQIEEHLGDCDEWFVKIVDGEPILVTEHYDQYEEDVA